MKLSVTAALASTLMSATQGELLRKPPSAPRRKKATTQKRELWPELDPNDTECKGTTLKAGEHLVAGESICNTINGEMVYFGIRTYDSTEPGYKIHRVETWSEHGMFTRELSAGEDTMGEGPTLKLRMSDGHLKFGYNSMDMNCLPRPGKRGEAVEVKVEGPLPDIMNLRDNEGTLAWKKYLKTLPSGEVVVSFSDCYPETPSKCVTALKEKNRLSWDEYVCEFNSEGNPVTQFGLDKTGLFALWHNGERIWRPRPGYHVRGDYLHLQKDAHLTLYRDEDPIEYTWVSDCHNAIHPAENTKIVVSDGDVTQRKEDGTTYWSLLGSLVDSGETDIEPVCHTPCA